jgi:hypothetical protein
VEKLYESPQLEIKLKHHLGNFIGGIIKSLALRSYVMGMPCREMSDDDWVELKDVFKNRSRTVREYLIKESGEEDSAIEAALEENDGVVKFLDLNLDFFYRAIYEKSQVAFWYYCQRLFEFVSAQKQQSRAQSDQVSLNASA